MRKILGELSLWYKRIFRPLTVGVRAIVLNPQGQVMLIKHTYLDGWYLPGGGVKKNENPEAAIQRELDEELRLSGEVKIDRLLGVYLNQQGYNSDYVILYLVRCDGSYVNRASLEIADAQFFSVEDYPGDLSRGTRRRLSEYDKENFGGGIW